MGKFTVGGSKDDRATIKGWLNQICSGVEVDPDTGDVSLNPPPAGPGLETWKSGCECLKALIAGPRSVTIHPLKGPGDTVPGSGRPPDPNKPGDKGEPDKTIGSYNGGMTGCTKTGGTMDGGKPGTGDDGNAGADTDVWIDMSDNADEKGPKGYDIPLPAPLKPIPNPMWLVLAHELTSGHAYHYTRGTGATTDPGREEQARTSENDHRREHRMDRRPVKG